MHRGTARIQSVDRAIDLLLAVADASLAGRVCPPSLPVVVAGDGRERQGGVGDGAGQRADVFQRLPAGYARIARIAVVFGAG